MIKKTEVSCNLQFFRTHSHKKSEKLDNILPENLILKTGTKTEEPKFQHRF